MVSIRPPSLPDIAPADRVTPREKVIVVVDGLAGAPLAPLLVAAFDGRAARVRLLVRNKPGFDLTVGGAAAHPDALREAACAALDAAGSPWIVAEGIAWLACLSPTFALLGATSPSLVALDPDVRAHRDRFDLVLYDARPGTVERLVERLRAA